MQLTTAAVAMALANPQHHHCNERVINRSGGVGAHGLEPRSVSMGDHENVLLALAEDDTRRSLANLTLCHTRDNEYQYGISTVQPLIQSG